MRALQVVTRRQLRGAEVFASQLADVLVERGHDARVLGLYESAPSVPETERAESVDLGASGGSRLSLRTVWRLARSIQEYDPDIVQANGSDTLKHTVLARRACRGRWPIVYRNISVASRWLRGPLHRAWNRHLMASVDHVVSVSEASARDFIDTYRVPEGRVTVIPQSVIVPDRSARHEAREFLSELTGGTDDHLMLMHIGSFTPEKDHAFLLRVFREVVGKVPSARLALVGTGELVPEVSQLVSQLDLEDRVHLLGSRADAATLVAAADLLLLTSRVEGMPGVVLEAAAQAVPTVATDVGGVSEAVCHGETGLLVRPGDLDSFAAAAADLLESQERREAMGVAARRFVEKEFSLQVVASRYERLYDRLVSERT